MPSNKGVNAALELIEKDPSKILSLIVGGHRIEKPGQFVPKSDAQDAPQLSYAANPGTTYILIALDIDAPFQSFTLLGPILHWIQGGFKLSTSSDDPQQQQQQQQQQVLQTSEPFVANYIGPAPPPPSGPHRYCFFLYEQPADFDGKAFAPANGAKLGNVSRMWTSLDAWVGEMKLGPLVAFNYFSSN